MNDDNRISSSKVFRIFMLVITIIMMTLITTLVVPAISKSISNQDNKIAIHKIDNPTILDSETAQ